MDKTLSDAQILGQGEGTSGRGKGVCEDKGCEGTRQAEGRAGSSVWLEHPVSGTLMFQCLHGRLSLYVSVLLPNRTGKSLRAETVYFDSILCNLINIY